MISTTAFLTLALRCATTIHPDTAFDVARTESSFNPYAIGVVGQKQGIFPKNYSDAVEHINRLKSKGKNYSVGLMQINQANFSRYNVTAEQLLDPCKNLSVFEKIITDCYLRGGTLIRALSCYYTGNFNTGQKPESKFAQTSYVQRIGYTVPSTRTDQVNQPEQTNSPKQPPSVRWPSGVTRGDLNSPDVKSVDNTPSVRYPSRIVRGAFVTDNK